MLTYTGGAMMSTGRYNMRHIGRKPQAIKATLAEREALRILEAKESHFYAATLDEETAKRSDTLTWWDPQDDTRAFLAEALAAFCEEGQ